MVSITKWHLDEFFTILGNLSSMLYPPRNLRLGARIGPMNLKDPVKSHQHSLHTNISVRLVTVESGSWQRTSNYTMAKCLHFYDIEARTQFKLTEQIV